MWRCAAPFPDAFGLYVQTTYGMSKAVGELLVAEYTRKGGDSSAEGIMAEAPNGALSGHRSL
jgi:hypothetical protein